MGDRRLSAARVLFGTSVGLLFLLSLAGLVLTGPVVIRVRPVEVHVDVSARRLEQSVRTLCTDFAPRDSSHPENLTRAASWIADRFREANLTTEIQGYDLTQGRFHNVIARRAGAGTNAGTIVVGAHYDAIPGSPGANDNASGVAVLLELARTLPARTPHHDLVFAAFCTEEPPFFATENMGSHVFARDLRARGERVELMVALDLVGYYSDQPGSQQFPFPGLSLLYPSRGNFVAVVGGLRAGRSIEVVKKGLLSAQTELPVYSFRAPRFVAPVDLSDHWSFEQMGYPAVLVTDTAFLRYPHYHSAEDTPDKLDYDRMADLVYGLHGVLLHE